MGRFESVAEDGAGAWKLATLGLDSLWAERLGCSFEGVFPIVEAIQPRARRQAIFIISGSHAQSEGAMPSSVELSVAPFILKEVDRTGNQEGWRDGCGSERINYVRGNRGTDREAGIVKKTRDEEEVKVGRRGRG